jgi:hypothetical protein
MQRPGQERSGSKYEAFFSGLSISFLAIFSRNYKANLPFIALREPDFQTQTAVYPAKMLFGYRTLDGVDSGIRRRDASFLKHLRRAP